MAEQAAQNDYNRGTKNAYMRQYKSTGYVEEDVVDDGGAIAEIEEDYDDSSEMDEDDYNEYIQQSSPNPDMMTRSQTEPHIPPQSLSKIKNRKENIDKKNKNKKIKHKNHTKNHHRDEEEITKPKDPRKPTTKFLKSKSLHSQKSYKKDLIVEEDELDIESIEDDEEYQNSMDAVFDLPMNQKKDNKNNNKNHLQQQQQQQQQDKAVKKASFGGLLKSFNRLGGKKQQSAQTTNSPQTPESSNSNNNKDTRPPSSSLSGDKDRKDSNKSTTSNSSHKSSLSLFSGNASIFNKAKNALTRSDSNKDSIDRFQRQQQLEQQQKQYNSNNKNSKSSLDSFRTQDSLGFNDSLNSDTLEDAAIYRSEHRKSSSKSNMINIASKFNKLKKWNTGRSSKDILSKTPEPNNTQTALGRMKARKSPKKQPQQNGHMNGKDSHISSRKRSTSTKDTHISSSEPPTKNKPRRSATGNSDKIKQPLKRKSKQSKKSNYNNNVQKRHSVQPQHISRSHSQIDSGSARRHTEAIKDSVNGNKNKGTRSYQKKSNRKQLRKTVSHVDTMNKRQMNKLKDEYKSDDESSSKKNKKNHRTHNTNKLAVNEKKKPRSHSRNSNSTSNAGDNKHRRKSGGPMDDKKTKNNKSTKKDSIDSIMFAADKKCKFRIKNEIFEIFEYYKPIRLIGSGAYAVVCEAIDERTKKRVAIKKNKHIFDDIRDARRILREVKLLLHFSKYKHPDLIDLYDCLPPSISEIQDFEDVYIVMPLLESNLCKIITSKQKLSNLHYQYLTYQVLRGLKFIHASGVIHRDIKPENILLNGSDCDVKIIDFGLARGVLGTDESDNPENGPKATEYVCTRWYRSPEVMCSGGRYDEKMDVWGVGCLLAEMILRRPLFPGANYLDQLQQIFDIMGTPKAYKWILNDQARSWVQKLPKHNGKNFKKMIAHKFENEKEEQLDNCVDLLYRLLELNPADRVSAADSLKHPYFQDMHDEDEIFDGDNKFDLSFEFEQSIKTKFGVRHMMYQALSEYHKKMWNKIKKKEKRKKQKELKQKEKNKKDKKDKNQKHRHSKHHHSNSKEHKHAHSSRRHKKEKH